ncbi:hypothetical protein FGRMN_4910 [Fusarium graminum]|nr:hypothetical protein FGRMN_4910 [Fusarium graminum]
MEELEVEIPNDFREALNEEAIKEAKDRLDEAWGDYVPTGGSTVTSTDTETTEEAKSTASTGTTSQEETTTTEAITENTTIILSTLLTTTRHIDSSEASSGTARDGLTTKGFTSGQVTLTTELATTTILSYYPCITRAGPSVETPYRDCMTTSNDERYVITAPMISS